MDELAIILFSLSGLFAIGYFSLIISRDRETVRNADMIHIEDLWDHSLLSDGEAIVSVFRQSGNEYTDALLFPDAYSAVSHAVSVLKRSGIQSVLLIHNTSASLQVRRSDFDGGAGGYNSKRIGWVQVEKA
jgi:hypothetical protein